MARFLRYNHALLLVLLTFAFVIWFKEKESTRKRSNISGRSSNIKGHKLGMKVPMSQRINKNTNRKVMNQPLEHKTSTTPPNTRGYTSKVKVFKPESEEDLCPACVVRYNTDSSVNEQFFCRNITIKPTAPICLYPKEEDNMVSASIMDSGIWEGGKVKIFQNVLRRNPQLSVLDVGANLGLYSLVAASLGRRVLAVEPVPSTLLRFHKAIKLGQFEGKITVLQNIVSDKHGRVSMAVGPSNKGGSRVSDCANPSMKCIQVQSIYLDDLGLFAHKKLNMTKAFLKLDIEGSEHLALSRANVLFELIHIPYVVTEWMNINFYCFIPYPPHHRYKLEQMIGFFAVRGYTPYHFATRGKRLRAKRCSRWPKEVIWVLDSAPYPLNEK